MNYTATKIKIEQLSIKWGIPKKNIIVSNLQTDINGGKFITMSVFSKSTSRKTSKSLYMSDVEELTDAVIEACLNVFEDFVDSSIISSWFNS